MGRKLPSTAGDLNTSSGFRHLGLCHGDLTVASHPVQPNCNGLKARGDGEKGIAFMEEVENKRGRLCLVGTCFFPLMMADKSLPSLMSPRQVCTEQLLFGPCYPVMACVRSTYTAVTAAVK